MSEVTPQSLTHLGQVSNAPLEQVELIPLATPIILVVRFAASEFTSLCPVTSQADFGKIEITYEPHKSLIETKSLKLFLARYRTVKMFNELIVDDIATKLFEQARPAWMSVTGSFNNRGGIGVTVTAHREQALVPGAGDVDTLLHSLKEAQ